MRTFIEETPDKGWELLVHARNNQDEYILTSARMHDLYSEYADNYGMAPSSAWYHRHAQFNIKNK